MPGEPERASGRARSRSCATLPIELADVVIRILDFCGRWGIDLKDAMRAKMA
jgi:hypothetical protein